MPGKSPRALPWRLPHEARRAASEVSDALLGRDAEREILAAIAPSPRLEPTARFEVYAQAYRLRLAGFLAEDFKVLNNALGDAGFHTLTHAYIAATPSRHRNARWYARDLPDFMQATAPWNESRSLVDIARLERALADAFDATDAPAASRAALAGLAPDAWPQIRLIFQESATMLSLARGITAAFTAAAAEAPCPEPDETQDECVLVWRNRDAHLAYRELTAAKSSPWERPSPAKASPTYALFCNSMMPKPMKRP